MIYTASDWKDYQCLDAGDGEKLEIWKGITLRRPDPQAIWPKDKKSGWNAVDAHTTDPNPVEDHGSIKRNFRNPGQLTIRD